MNAYNEDREGSPVQPPEPFPQPKTIPPGWDLSGLVFPPQPPPVKEPGSDSDIEAGEEQ